MENIIPILITLIAIIFISTLYGIYNKIKNRKLSDMIDKNFGEIPTRIYDLDINSISSYWLEKKSNEIEKNYIDNITWNDLDMDKVYSRINNCLTSTGEEYLYSKLHEPELSNSNLSKRELLVESLDADDSLRRDLQNILLKIGKKNYNGISRLCYNISSKRLRNTFIYPILAVLPLLFIAIFLLSPQIGLIGLICALTLNGTIHYMTSIKIEHELSAIKYFSVLLWGAKNITELLIEYDFEVVDELKRAYNTFYKLGGKMSSFGQKKMSEVDAIIDYYKIISLSDIRNYNKIIASIDQYSDEFIMLYRSIGEIDMALCILSYRKSLTFHSTPVFLENNEVISKDIYHPLIENPVSNSVSLPKYNLISGSNASGKSTFIKSIALNAILSQTINTCTAKSFKINHTHIMTSMAIRDDINSGDSYFISEIKSLKRIVDMITKTNCLCIIDEILRGTNTIERIAASISVLKYIASQDCICIVATHDIELTSALDHVYKNYHFSEKVTDDGVEFDYLIHDGATKSKNAIYLLEYLGFDENIISDAKLLAKDSF